MQTSDTESIFIASSRTSTVMQSAQHGQIIALKPVNDLLHIEPFIRHKRHIQSNNKTTKY